jgi:hypothetical protein
MIDNLPSTYTVSDLKQIKSRHEYFVSAHLTGRLFPSTWIESIEVIQFRRFQPGTKLQFGRVNHVYGVNGVGKTVVMQMLDSALSGVPNERFSGLAACSRVVVSRADGKQHEVDVSMQNSTVTYHIGGRRIPIFPEAFIRVHLSEELKPHSDNIEAIRMCLSMPQGFIEGLISEDGFHGVTTSQYSTTVRRTNPYLTRDLLVDVGSGEIQPFRTCSGSEQTRVLLDIAIASAVETCRYRPTVLIIDTPSVFFLEPADLEPYINYLHSRQAHFQSFFVSADPFQSLSWLGWQQIGLSTIDGKTTIDSIG